MYDVIVGKIWNERQLVGLQALLVMRPAHRREVPGRLSNRKGAGGYLALKHLHVELVRAVKGVRRINTNRVGACLQDNSGDEKSFGRAVHGEFSVG